MNRGQPVLRNILVETLFSILGSHKDTLSEDNRKQFVEINVHIPKCWRDMRVLWSFGRVQCLLYLGKYKIKKKLAISKYFILLWILFY